MICTVIVVIEKFELKIDQKMLMSWCFNVAVESSKLIGGREFHRRGRQLK